MIVNEEDLDAFIAHYGIRGMKWGKRKARSPEEEAHRKAMFKKVAITSAVVAGAALTAVVLKQHGNAQAAKAVEAAAKFARENPVQGRTGGAPSPFEMRMQAGIAAQRIAMDKIGNQSLTDKAWRDSANLARERRAMEDVTNNLLLGNRDQLLRAMGGR